MRSSLKILNFFEIDKDHSRENKGILQAGIVRFSKYLTEVLIRP